MKANVILIKPSSEGIIPIPLSSPLEVHEHSSPGDLAIVYPKSYEIGQERLIFPTGVNWDFLGKVEIIGSNTTGTVTDNGIQVDVKINGNPVFLNTNENVCPFNLNSASTINCSYEYSAKLSFDILSQGENCQIVEEKNDFNLGITAIKKHTRDGEFSLEFDKSIPGGYGIDLKNTILIADNFAYGIVESVGILSRSPLRILFIMKDAPLSASGYPDYECAIVPISFCITVGAKKVYEKLITV